MTTIALPAVTPHIEERVASAVREGLAAKQKRLPAWLFYDEAGSRLFDEITERPEYYLTRTERGILAAHAEEMLEMAAESTGVVGGCPPPSGRIRLRLTELGAGSADKTRLLLDAAVKRQGVVIYEPLDVSASALWAAQARIEREIPGVTVAPRVMDYTESMQLDEPAVDERRLVLYIGSSIGNFEPWEAARILRRVRASLRPGDGLLLGVDLVKDEPTLLAAYDDVAGVTAAFNLNMLERLNRALWADFDLECFEHQARWNREHSRMEMHLVSRTAQRVRLEGIGLDVEFRAGESIHTENSYKYLPGQAQAMLEKECFRAVSSWTDAKGWFGVCLGRAE